MVDEIRSGRTGEGAATGNPNGGDTSSLPDADHIVNRVNHFQWRVIQDALSSATATFWRKRAEQLEAARPTPGDYFGRAISGEVAIRDQRLARQAQNCRDHATIVEFQDFREILAAVLDESKEVAR